MSGRSCSRIRPLRSLLSVVAIGLLIVACGGDSANSDGNGNGSDEPANGAPANEAQTIFVEVGCAECHGDLGEGIDAEGTSSLQGTRMILAQFSTRVRNGRGAAMPGYTAEQISDEEIVLLHEWLRNQ